MSDKTKKQTFDVNEISNTILVKAKEFGFSKGAVVNNSIKYYYENVLKHMMVEPKIK